jgi:tetratricopeptide (TPR) repeat protein
MEDEEYLAEIKEVSRSEKLKYYTAIRPLYADNASFYIDIAQHIFESGFKQEAINIISNAAEVSNGDVSVLLAIAYSFEDWKEFDKAIELYRQVLSIRPDNLPVYRDLAWALYQAGKKQEAVETFYNAIKQNFETGEYYHVYTKASMLSEMNSIIAAHKDSLDLSRIPSALVHPMSVDLRIILAGNLGYIYNMEIKEPGGKICSGQNPVSKNGGYFDKSWNYYGYPSEYNIKKAIEGKYRISIGYYDYYGSNGPQMVRIICFRNYGRKEQKLSIQNVIMNNQNGVVEIGEVEW